MRQYENPPEGQQDDSYLDVYHSSGPDRVIELVLGQLHLNAGVPVVCEPAAAVDMVERLQVLVRALVGARAHLDANLPAICAAYQAQGASPAPMPRGDTWGFVVALYAIMWWCYIEVWHLIVEHGEASQAYALGCAMHDGTLAPKLSTVWPYAMQKLIRQEPSQDPDFSWDLAAGLWVSHVGPLTNTVVEVTPESATLFCDQAVKPLITLLVRLGYGCKLVAEALAERTSVPGPEGPQLFEKAVEGADAARAVRHLLRLRGRCDHTLEAVARASHNPHVLDAAEQQLGIVDYCPGVPDLVSNTAAAEGSGKHEPSFWQLRDADWGVCDSCGVVSYYTMHHTSASYREDCMRCAVEMGVVAMAPDELSQLEPGPVDHLWLLHRQAGRVSRARAHLRATWCAAEVAAAEAAVGQQQGQVFEEQQQCTPAASEPDQFVPWDAAPQWNPLAAAQPEVCPVPQLSAMAATQPERFPECAEGGYANAAPCGDAVSWVPPPPPPRSVIERGVQTDPSLCGMWGPVGPFSSEQGGWGGCPHPALLGPWLPNPWAMPWGMFAQQGVVPGAPHLPQLWCPPGAFQGAMGGVPGPNVGGTFRPGA